MSPPTKHPMLRRGLLIALAALVTLAAAVAVAVVVPFSGLKPAEDGARLPGDATLVKDGFVILYVLPAGANEIVLIDCGGDPKGVAIKAELRRHGLGADAVKAILLTHGHQDHTGGCLLFPNAEILTFEGDRGLVEGREAAKGPLSRFRGRTSCPARVTRALHDGDTLVFGSLHVQAFAVPGHTAGSGAFLANGVLYMGDSVMAGKNERLRPAPWIFSDDQKQCTASVEMLAHRLATERAEVKALAFGHSGWLPDSRPLVKFSQGS